MTPETLALAYALLACLPIAIQIALAAGAPLGRFSVGGRFEGRLPDSWRAMALVQATIFMVMALSVLDHGGVIRLGFPDWTIWITLAISLLSFLGHSISPSAPERRLGAPVAFGMSAALLALLFL